MDQKKNFTALGKIDRSIQVAGAQRSDESACCSPARGHAPLRGSAMLQSWRSKARHPRGREEPDDLMTVMSAMADPRKTLSVYVAMTAAAAMVGGRPLPEAEQQEADELCRGFAQTDLTDGERRAVERLAKKRQWSV